MDGISIFWRYTVAVLLFCASGGVLFFFFKFFNKEEKSETKEDHKKTIRETIEKFYAEVGSSEMTKKISILDLLTEESNLTEFDRDDILRVLNPILRWITETHKTLIEEKNIAVEKKEAILYTRAISFKVIKIQEKESLFYKLTRAMEYFQVPVQFSLFPDLET